MRLLYDVLSEVGRKITQSLRASLSALNAHYRYTEGREIAWAELGASSVHETHVIIVLTDLEMTRWLAKGAPAEQQLLIALDRLDSKTKFIVVYDKQKGLNSPVFAQIGKQIDTKAVQQLLWSQEALIFRHETPEYGLWSLWGPASLLVYMDVTISR